MLALPGVLDTGILENYKSFNWLKGGDYNTFEMFWYTNEYIKHLNASIALLLMEKIRKLLEAVSQI